ncbi:DNA-binding transcriptional regulator, MarR family [Streptomyces sp. Ncost-T6T-1]|uniref:MarR family winged helix-turn-helix transcriptional regulator n=1 Tax=Streptomyces sp. Ncost-T6T-1 TaxID=1100828 RepID=UPI000804B929|nr:MarR family winged helix-turn-helix transcriptional regulator [Streptomyces sp. Ncost-T6T-1]SBV03536.1 DNA-binding transcriptional regulator, MarR family [Streptomyces sp. Ncost-T6T-1]
MDIEEGTPPQRLRALPSRLTNQAALVANRIVDRGLAEAGARRYHYALLAASEEYGPSSQAALGRRTGIDRSDMVATVNDLAERRLLERAPDPEDRRRNIISITAAGRQELTRLDELLAAAQDAFLAPLSAADRRTLTDLLTRLVDHHRGEQG